MADQNIEKDVLKKTASTNMISRRAFFERATALGVSVAAASSIWKEAEASTPKKGGTLRIGTDGGATTDSFDSRVTISTNHITAAQWSVYERLTYLDEKGAPQPQLAESWETNADASVWRFQIRKDVEFHNGKTLTPQDVVASFAYVGSEETKAADPKKIVGRIKEMKVDGNAVVMDIGESDADWPIIMSSSGLLVAPEGTAGDQWDQSGNGTGPYVLKDFEPGVRIRGEKNPNYYNDGEAHFDAFDSLNIADAASRTSALRTGDVDIITRPDTKTARRLGETDGIHLVEGEGNLHYTAPMLADTAPFDDNNVRLALKHLMKRDELLQKILSGFGYIGNDVPIGRGQQYYNDQLEQRAYDPDKAKFHLKKAGMSNLNVTLSAGADAPFPGAVDTATLISEWAKPAGVTINIERTPSDGYWSDVWLKKPWCLAYWSGRPTVGQMISAAYTSDTAWNDGKWKNERVDELNRMARSELDNSKRQEMYFEIQRIIHEEGSVIIPVFGSFLHAASDNLGHPKFRGKRYLDNYAITRTGWFKS